MRILIHGRKKAKAEISVVEGLLQLMRTQGLHPIIPQHWREVLADEFGSLEHYQLKDGLPKGIGMILSLGGDGTLLDTVTMSTDHEIPVLGINLGRLGFLSNVRMEDISEAVFAIAQGNYTLAERSLIRLDTKNGLFGEKNFALNEVAVHKRDSSSMITIHAYIEDRYLNTYWADGLIISTPTGSTAYSLSVGGPVLDPGCNDLIIAPIAPHNLNVRPLVVPDNATIKLVADVRDDKYLVSLDSRNEVLESSVELTIRKAKRTFKLVQLEGQDFLNTLRTKLTWGLDLRSGPQFDHGKA